MRSHRRRRVAGPPGPVERRSRPRRTSQVPTGAVEGIAAGRRRRPFEALTQFQKPLKYFFPFVRHFSVLSFSSFAHCFWPVCNRRTFTLHHRCCCTPPSPIAPLFCVLNCTPPYSQGFSILFICLSSLIYDFHCSFVLQLFCVLVVCSLFSSIGLFSQVCWIVMYCICLSGSYSLLWLWFFNLSLFNDVTKRFSSCCCFFYAYYYILNITYNLAF